MQVNPLPTTISTDPRLPEATALAHVSGKDAVPPVSAVPLPEELPRTQAALPEPDRVSVSVDQTREFVYRFVDVRTGEVVSQTPPEAVLKVVREIQNQLKAEEQRRTAAVNIRG